MSQVLVVWEGRILHNMNVNASRIRPRRGCRAQKLQAQVLVLSIAVDRGQTRLFGWKLAALSQFTRNSKFEDTLSSRVCLAHHSTSKRKLVLLTAFHLLFLQSTTSALPQRRLFNFLLQLCLTVPSHHHRPQRKTS